MERLRTTRLSPIPTTSNVFPTVLEEPVTPSDNPDSNSILGSSPTADPRDSNCLNTQQTGHLFRKHRRRLPLVQPCNISKNRSSRSFDSGISCLLQSSASTAAAGNGYAGTDSRGLPLEPGSPGPIASDPGMMHQNPGSPNHISCSRQSYMSSSPCNSPGPRSPRGLPSTPGRLNGGGTPSMLATSSGGGTGGGASQNGFFGPSFNSRRFSEQVESYSNTSKGSSEDSDSQSPPTEPSPPPLNGGSPPSTSPILRPSRRMLPETPKTPYNVWQQSRDSLDSGVYSRSTTCDSYPGRKSGSPILSSTSPPTLARHSWRRGVARLPEPPISSSVSDPPPPSPAAVQATPINNQITAPAVSAYIENNGMSNGSGCNQLMEDSSKRVHFEQNQNFNNQNQIPVNSGNNPGSPSTKSRMGLLASLKNTYNSTKLNTQLMEQSSPVKSSAGILTKLHEKLAGTRSLGSSSCNNSSPTANPTTTGITQQNNLHYYNHQQDYQQQNNQQQIILDSSQLLQYNTMAANSYGNLDVPKLRDLKSHSFPPPFTNSSDAINPSQHLITASSAAGYTGSGSSASVSASSTGGSETNTSSFADAPIYSLTDSSNSPTSAQDQFETTDERRKRWQLLHNHSSAAFIATG